MYPLTTSRLRIAPLGEEDVDAFAAYRRDPDVARWQSWTIGYSRSDALALVRSQPSTALPPPGEWLQLAVHSAESLLLYGDIGLHQDARQPDTFEVGITFDRAHQGRGLATEALQRVLEFLFRQQHAHRVVASCDARNDAVASLLRRLQFRHESHQVDADFFKGEWTTLDGYALLAREFSGSTPLSDPDPG